MNIQIFLRRAAGTSFLAAIILATAAGLFAQVKVNVDTWKSRPLDVATGNNLYCAGFVQTSPLNTAPKEVTSVANKIVGAWNEQDGWLYSQNNFVYINGGANKGVKVGDMFSVIRPRGEVESRWTKKDRLGFYVQELGVIEVVDVKSEVSVARVKNSCDNILLGDLIYPAQQRVSPRYENRPAMDIFGDPSGKATGRIFMARDSQEALSSQNIIYVDLGADNSVQIGDRLTIFRPLGKGNLFINDEDESVSARDEGFQSDAYRGGKFSNQAARKYGSQADRKVVTTEAAKQYRPKGLRKVVGEAVILNVKEATATAVIVRNAQEIHTGDWVEIQ